PVRGEILENGEGASHRECPVPEARPGKPSVNALVSEEADTVERNRRQQIERKTESKGHPAASVERHDPERQGRRGEVDRRKKREPDRVAVVNSLEVAQGLGGYRWQLHGLCVFQGMNEHGSG